VPLNDKYCECAKSKEIKGKEAKNEGLGERN
jgi:hypothetical protein